MTVLESSITVRNLVDLVEPWVGASGAANAVVGPQVPFGSINPSPDTPGGETDGYSRGQPIRGFSQLHVSGTGGGGKYGNVLISPQVGAISAGETAHDSAVANEIISACRYGVSLTRWGVAASVTPTHNAALYRFTFPASAQSHLVFDLAHNIPGDIVGSATETVAAGSSFTIAPADRTFSGTARYKGGWGGGHPYTIHFVAQVNKVPSAYGAWRNGVITGGVTTHASAQDGERIGGYFSFTTTANEQVQLKIAVSLQSAANARALLKAQIPAWDFNGVEARCRTRWNEALSAILIDDPTASPAELRKFYTQLHRTMLMPRDRTGDNPWSATTPYFDDHYTDWDLFRTSFPLMTLVKPSVTAKVINSYITRFRRNGGPNDIPDAFIAGTNGSRQGGDSVDVVIADAFLKDVSGVDWAEAYAILKHHAVNGRSPAYVAGDRGWAHESGAQAVSASRTLEYALNDHSAALVAYGLGDMAEYDRLLARARGWEKLWDSAATSDGFSGFVKPKSADGTWYGPLDLKTISGWGPGYYEGSAWIYSFFAPHDMAKVIALMGGRAQFLNRLNWASSQNLFRMSNEPSFLVPWLYHYALRPDLASDRVRTTLATYGTSGPPNNDDSGALAAWYVFGRMGLFPSAGQEFYFLHGSMFRSMTLQRENGAKIVIKGADASATSARYVQSATINAVPLTRTWVRHPEVQDGATLVFNMGTTPSGWGTNLSAAPPPRGMLSNLALGRAATASGACASGEQGRHAVDGSTTTKWCDGTSSASAKFLQIDLGADRVVSRWVVRHASANGEPSSWNTRDFTLQVSTDGITFVDADSVTGNGANVTDRNIPAARGRYFRLVGTNWSSDGKARIYELELWGV